LPLATPTIASLQLALVKLRLSLLLSICSLPLFLLTATLWPASYLRGVEFFISHNDVAAPDEPGYLCNHYLLESVSGSLCIAVEESKDYNRHGDWTDEGGQEHHESAWPNLPAFTFSSGTFPLYTPFPEQSQWGWRWRHWGLAFGCESYRGVHAGSDLHYIMFPYWLLCPLFAATPLFYYRRYRQCHRQRRFGLCPTCGYDLRASKEKCPECGSPIPPTARHPAPNP